jgi:hypothetical protein
MPVLVLPFNVFVASFIFTMLPSSDLFPSSSFLARLCAFLLSCALQICFSRILLDMVAPFFLFLPVVVLLRIVGLLPRSYLGWYFHAFCWIDPALE